MFHHGGYVFPPIIYSKNCYPGLLRYLAGEVYCAINEWKQLGIKRIYERSKSDGGYANSKSPLAPL